MAFGHQLTSQSDGLAGGDNTRTVAAGYRPCRPP